jgi:hypothetical protein
MRCPTESGGCTYTTKRSPSCRSCGPGRTHSLGRSLLLQRRERRKGDRSRMETALRLHLQLTRLRCGATSVWRTKRGSGCVGSCSCRSSQSRRRTCGTRSGFWRSTTDAGAPYMLQPSADADEQCGAGRAGAAAARGPRLLVQHGPCPLEEAQCVCSSIHLTPEQSQECGCAHAVRRCQARGPNRPCDPVALPGLRNDTARSCAGMPRPCCTLQSWRPLKASVHVLPPCTKAHGREGPLRLTVAGRLLLSACCG